MIDYSVYLVTDDPSRYVGDWLDNVVAAVDGGVTCVQYRDTQSNGRVQYARLRSLMDALAPRRVPVVVNNDAALALAAGAAGVHVGQGDLPPAAVRRAVGGRLEIGFSLTALEQVAQRADDVAASDAFGIGPVWDATRTKADAAPEMGVAGFKEILEVLDGRPAVAIGGITPERAAELVRAGADGVAVVSAFSRAADPAAVARRFRGLF